MKQPLFNFRHPLRLVWSLNGSTNFCAVFGRGAGSATFGKPVGQLALLGALLLVVGGCSELVEPNVPVAQTWSSPQDELASSMHRTPWNEFLITGWQQGPSTWNNGVTVSDSGLVGYAATISESGDFFGHQTLPGEGWSQIRAASSQPGQYVLGGTQLVEQGRLQDGQPNLVHNGVVESYVQGMSLRSWSLAFSSVFAEVNDLAFGPTGFGLVVGGSSQDSLVLNQTKWDSLPGRQGFVALLTAAGIPIFATSLEAESYSVVTQVAVSPSGQIAVAGYHRGELLPNRLQLGGESENAFVVVYTGLGQPVWGRSLAGAGRQRITDLGFNRNGELYLCGTFQGELLLGQTTLNYTRGSIPPPGVADFGAPFAAKMSAQGDFLWGHTPQCPGSFSALVQDPDSAGFWVTGYFDGPAEFNQTLTPQDMDGLVAHYTEEGEPNYSGVIARRQVYPQGIARLPNGALVVSGNFLGSARDGFERGSVLSPDLANNFVLNAGGWDVFLVFVEPSVRFGEAPDAFTP